MSTRPIKAGAWKLKVVANKNVSQTENIKMNVLSKWQLHSILIISILAISKGQISSRSHFPVACSRDLVNQREENRGEKNTVEHAHGARENLSFKNVSSILLFV